MYSGKKEKAFMEQPEQNKNKKRREEGPRECPPTWLHDYRFNVKLEALRYLLNAKIFNKITYQDWKRIKRKKGDKHNDVA